MSSGLCQYSNFEEFYCNRYYDENEVNFINPYHPEQNFSFYVISEDSKNNDNKLRGNTKYNLVYYDDFTDEMSNNDYDKMIFSFIIILNFLLLIVTLSLCIIHHIDVCVNKNMNYSMCPRRKRGHKLL
jgi:hypothetical protein